MNFLEGIERRRDDRDAFGGAATAAEGNPERLRDVGVALGGGGARGLAHIGVLHHLRRAGYHIAALAGTSIGGIMAAVYAAGLDPDEIAVWAQRAIDRGLFRVRPSAAALLDIGVIRDVLAEVLGDMTFEQARCPVALTAVDLEGGEEVVLTSGRLLDAVLATMAMPLIFPPQLTGGTRLVDGGVLDPVPVAPLRALFRGPVVAVTLSPSQRSPLSPQNGSLLGQDASLGPSSWRFGAAVEALYRSVRINSCRYVDLRLEVDRPEVIVRPDVSGIGALSSPKAQPLIEAGWQAMESGLLQLGECYAPRVRCDDVGYPAREASATRSRNVPVRVPARRVASGVRARYRSRPRDAHSRRSR
jgi:NTE family protein